MREPASVILKKSFAARKQRVLFFAVEVIGLCSFHDHFLKFLVDHRPLAAVGIITGITGSPAAARIIGNYVINKIFVTGVGELMRFARLEEKRVACPLQWSIHPCRERCLGPTRRDKVPIRPRARDTDKAICPSESAPARDQTDVASTNPASPAPARARSKYSSMLAQTFPSAISAPAPEHLSDSLCA